MHNISEYFNLLLRINGRNLLKDSSSLRMFPFSNLTNEMRTVRLFLGVVTNFSIIDFNIAMLSTFRNYTTRCSASFVIPCLFKCYWMLNLYHKSLINSPIHTNLHSIVNLRGQKCLS